MEIEEEIKSLRYKIDALDDEILSLLNRRAMLVTQMGRIKLSNNLRVYDPRREEEIINRLRINHCGPFPERAIFHVFHEIISACRSLARKIDVTYLGPPGTHTHLACLEYFGSSIEAFPKDSIEEVFEAVKRGETHYGVVPIENSTEGMVNRTLDMFIEYEVRIWGEILVKISHDLLSRNGNSEEIERIYSHPQVFGQCQKWLRKNHPHTPLIETASTAKAAQMALQEPMAAAIASPLAGRLYGLKTVVPKIEDAIHNYTRFFILGQQSQERTGKDKTSILFSIPHVPGSLYTVLKVFSEKGINLTKIESRPIKERPWEYIFFIDFEGHAQEPVIDQALSDIRGRVLSIKILGSYPKES